MSKLKITQEQYNSILLHEGEIRSNSLLNETLNDDVEILEEGWKEVVLGVAMMLGVGLSGQNKLMAQNAVKNTETMSQIKSTLEDSTKTLELVNFLKEKGMKDPETKLAQNAEKVMDSYNEIAKHDKLKYRVDVRVVNNLQQLKNDVNQGYAVKGVDVSSSVGNDNDNNKPQDQVQSVSQNIPIMVTDTMDMNLGGDNLFVTGGFTLSQGGVDTIAAAINEVAKQGGKIEQITVESSTDAEQMTKFVSNDDPTGNIQLANLRTQSISNELKNLGVSVNVSHREIPNNGGNVVSTREFKNVATNKEEIKALREKTSEFRYTKIKIVATFENKTPSTNQTTDNPTTIEPVSTLDVIKKYRFELVKVVELTGKAHKINTKINFKHRSFKCKKIRLGKINVSKCATF